MGAPQQLPHKKMCLRGPGGRDCEDQESLVVSPARAGRSCCTPPTGDALLDSQSDSSGGPAQTACSTVKPLLCAQLQRASFCG